jgi:hypothetical protein
MALIPFLARQGSLGAAKNGMRVLTMWVMGGVQGSDGDRRWRHGYLLRQVRH